MSSEIAIGAVLEGKVTAIKEYGAFVALVPGRSGLVHISQIASEYVKQVDDYLSVGDVVLAKVIDISEQGKISLSIKQVAPLKRKDGKEPEQKINRKPDPDQRPKKTNDKDRMNSLEDKLKKWIKSSEERMQDLQPKQKRK
ncbi:MAG TPA: S1 RNA-binding domain-containing protein [Bacillota bacterium]|nr:S1 RNA-binding domain-containing protein [Bacillota bacterium]